MLVSNIDYHFNFVEYSYYHEVKTDHWQTFLWKNNFSQKNYMNVKQRWH